MTNERDRTDRTDRTRRVAGESVLAVAAVACQVAHRVVGYDAGFMWIDLVGVPPMIAAYLWGPRAGLRVLLAPALWILLLEPVGWIGAGFKASATLAAMVAASTASGWLFIGAAAAAAALLAGGAGQLAALDGGVGEVVGALALAFPVAAGLAAAVRPIGRRPIPADRPGALALSIGCAAAARGALMVVADLLFAFPVFFGIPSAAAVQQQSPWSVFAWNAVQAAVDVALPGVAVLAIARSRRRVRDVQ